MISNSNQGAAFADCQSQIKDVVSRLNDLVVAMEVKDRGERVRDERQRRQSQRRETEQRRESQIKYYYFFTILATVQFYV